MKAPRGNTQKGVNQIVFRLLSRQLDGSGELLISDSPSGEGELSTFLSSQFPKARFELCDAYAMAPAALPSQLKFHQQGIHEYYRNQIPEKYNAVLCVSGVMCFDGIEELICQFHRCLKPQGLILITNDNIMTIRDRFNFLFFGNFKRFKLFSHTKEGNWNVLLPQAARMLLRRAGFQNFEVKYTAFYWEDLLWAPLAALIYPFFLFKILTSKSNWTFREKMQFFPVQSLLCRHYVIAARKTA